MVVIVRQGMGGGGGGGGGGAAAPRKVMVVAEPTRESTGALQYALSHAIFGQDELILLQIGNPSSWRRSISTFLKRPSMGSSTNTCQEEGGTAEVREVDFLEEMKHSCEVAQPTLSVRVVRVEMEGKAKDKASAIISQAKLLEVDVIIIGQKRSLSTALLGIRRSGAGGAVRGTRMIDTAEYLIENSPCTCVAVQRKGQNKGYVLNTKTHKNFWLLA